MSGRRAGHSSAGSPRVTQSTCVSRRALRCHSQTLVFAALLGGWDDASRRSALSGGVRLCASVFKGRDRRVITDQLQRKG